MLDPELYAKYWRCLEAPYFRRNDAEIQEIQHAWQRTISPVVELMDAANCDQCAELLHIDFFHRFLDAPAAIEKAMEALARALRKVTAGANPEEQTHQRFDFLLHLAYGTRVVETLERHNPHLEQYLHLQVERFNQSYTDRKNGVRQWAGK
jgi:hypothetical protein